jgi:hypothetical protein
MALAKRVPGTVGTSDTLLHSGLYPKLILPSNMSTDVTTPRTKPQKICVLCYCTGISGHACERGYKTRCRPLP